ncbi:MAG: hypothetical protein FWC00_01105 [Firmicutes bacterium]|nr:hypothetical protein [Bacillota bacterium]MCL2228409.1 hypothetical protein [Bacillota bacterium]
MDKFMSKRVERVLKPNAHLLSKQKREQVNTRINRFKFFTEIIYYHEPFDILTGKKDYNWVDTETGKIISASKRKEITDQEQIDEYASRGEILEIDNGFDRSQYESCRRAKDNFYGYALCNDWVYFCTFTIAKSEHDHDDKATKYYWQMFRQKLQKRFPTVKILAVPERHAKGNIHFHALLGDCDLENILVVAINPHTSEPVLQSGRQVYNLPLWDKGFSTVVKIDQESIENQLKAINYIIGYVTKQENSIGLNQKRYYRTRNLDFKNTEIKFTDKAKYESLLLSTFDINAKLVKHKENDRMIVFRVYN